MTKKKAPQAPANAPVEKISMGLLNASIWKNKTDKGNFYSVTFERRYRDGEGNWHSSHSYGSDDLLMLGKLADRAHSTIVDLRRAGSSE